MRESLSFEDIFEVPPYPVQSAFIESISGPGVYVLEAPMGIGKTEAALYVAYKLFVQRKAGGIYFALPTQATANKMFDRMRTFLNRVFDPNTPFRETLLLHGSAWLYETNMGVKDSDAASWFHGKKKRLLAPFAVGTIDQALMAVMNVKHNVVRAFGLAGKVVILDEVHSYDSYTGVILDELIRRLREMGCTVIILSATLTDTRRMSLLKLKDAERPASPYPLITALPEMDSEPRELSAKIAPSPLVTAHRVTNDADAIEEVLKRVEQGQQILWIENTVSEAQKRYLELTGRAAGFSDAIEIGLLHARFMQCDRTHNENYWVGLFGKEGKEKRQEHGRILVGTQVLEQSLDIDADFLVTRLCPTDMLLQRIGRLWRNRDNDAIRHTTQAEVWILAGEYQYLLKHKPAMGSTAWVYDQYILFRALEVWDKVSTLRLPQDIRYLIEETYFERDETGTLAKLKQDMERKRDNLRREARFGLSMLGKVSDDKAETRHSEMDTHDVLLLHSFDRRDDGSLSLVFPAHGGTPAGNALILTSGLKRTNRKQWRDCAKAIAEHIVTVPASQVPDTPFPRALELLGEYVYLGSKYDEEPTLQVAMVKDSESLAGFDGGTITNAYSLYYKELVGYFAEKNNLTEKDEGDEW
jgi:CRISPR-associated endonuclease/helicase Cas3